MATSENLTVSRNQLSAMVSWLETTEDADDALADEIWNAYRATSGNGRATVSRAAVVEAIYYAENVAEGGTWTRADQRALDQLSRRVGL